MQFTYVEECAIIGVGEKNLISLFDYETLGGTPKWHKTYTTAALHLK